jgi:two-component system nitrate/nitrite response regulator NarL
MSMISVALIDGHPITIEGLAHVLAAQGTFTVVAHGGNSQEALAVAEQHRPDLIILDLAIPGIPLAAISEITTKHPGTKIIVFTAASGVDHAVNALEAGARGYLPKSSKPDELADAVRAVAAGGTYISQQFGSEVVTALRNSSVRKIAMQALKLSAREDQIIHLLLGGKTNKEIASGLGVTERTVKHYMTVLMQKLNVRNRVEVAMAAQSLRGTPTGRQGLRLDDTARSSVADTSLNIQKISTRIPRVYN